MAALRWWVRVYPARASQQMSAKEISLSSAMQGRSVSEQHELDVVAVGMEMQPPEMTFYFDDEPDGHKSMRQPLKLAPTSIPR